MRLKSLDGLRGVAAAIVLLHHGLLTVPSLADAYYNGVPNFGSSLSSLVSYTPLHLAWAGTEAVYLFFVLSGMVLVLPVIRKGRAFSWAAYYPRRLVRLYIPIFAAVAFGGLFVMLIGRYQSPQFGPWINARPAQYTMMGVVQDVTLIFGNSRVISPLWSLRWEILFSILLPVFIAAATLATRLWWTKIGLAFGMIGVGSVLDNQFMFYLPMFAIGALLIFEWDRLSVFFSKFESSRWRWPVVIVLAIVLTTSHWTFLGLGLSRNQVRYVDWLPVVGVTLLVLIAAFCAPVRKVLEMRGALWLGAMSFSLYLVHEPLVIGARLLTASMSPWIGLLISVPLAILSAMGFAKFIEQPAHRLSKSAGVRWEAVMTRWHGRWSRKGLAERSSTTSDSTVERGR